ncbi:MAG: enoyl-CoA hydratase/isomerase family protein [Myxococcales bacterium]|nr:enoyl-CoA hydratase/isomerase family protein [Myxococcales bacterium]
MSASKFTYLLVDDRGPARVITINRPEALNALNAEVIDELTVAVTEAAEDDAVRGLVLTGAGPKSFVAGADIAAMSTMSPEEAMTFAGRGHALGEMLSSLPKPVIAAVNGFALGGGCELALACDFIYAAENARFGQPEVKLGVIPGFGGTQRLLRRVGAAMALELCMRGNMIRADEALWIGLANRVVGKGEAVDAAVAAIEEIAVMGPLAVAKAKELIHRGADMPLPEANQREIEAFAGLFSTEDQREGMAAFLAKREADFKGR